MTKRYLLSIITVVRNAFIELQTTIESIRYQTFEDFEYIVIDGNSTDGTKQLIHDNKDLIDIWISEKDRGVYDAMNKGLLLANGEYIIFMNAGDTFVNNDTLSNIRTYLEATYADVVYGNNYLLFNDSYKKLKYPNTMSKSWKGMPFSHQAAFFKKEAVLTHPFETNSIISDYIQVTKLYDKGYLFMYIPLPICVYEVGGLSDKKRRQSIYERWCFIRRRRNWFQRFKIDLYYIKTFMFGPLKAWLRTYIVKLKCLRTY